MEKLGLSAAREEILRQQVSEIIATQNIHQNKIKKHRNITRQNVINDLEKKLMQATRTCDILRAEQNLMKKRLDKSHKEVAEKTRHEAELNKLLESSARMISDLWHLHEAQTFDLQKQQLALQKNESPVHAVQQHQQQEVESPLLVNHASPEKVLRDAGLVSIESTIEPKLTQVVETQRPQVPPSIFSTSSLEHTCTRNGKYSIFQGLDGIIVPPSAHAAIADLDLESCDLDAVAALALAKVRERIQETQEYLKDQQTGNAKSGNNQKRRAWRFVEYGLTEAEAASVFMYTAETPLYRVLNTCCRNANRERVADFFPFLALFTQALKKIPCRRGTFWRSIKGDFAAQYKSKSKTVWWSFTSCTQNISIMTKFKPVNARRRSQRSVMFSIEDAYGADIADFCWGRESEEEILIPPGVEFEVRNKLDGKIDGSSSDIVSLKQIHMSFDAMTAMASLRKPGFPFQAEPPSVTAVESRRPSLLVRWKLPSFNGYPPKKIHLRWRKRRQTPDGVTKRTDLGEWNHAELQDPSLSSCILGVPTEEAPDHFLVDAKLLPNRVYEVGLRVENEFGNCVAWSYTCEQLSNAATTKGCPPDPPLGHTFRLSRLDEEQEKYTTMHITWIPLSFPEDGGHAVTDYEVQFFDMAANKASRGTSIIKITCTVPEATIKNVSKAGRYALRILARNCLGWSVPSEWRLMDPCWHVDEEVFIRSNAAASKGKVAKGNFRRVRNGRIMVRSNSNIFGSKSVEALCVNVQMKACQDEFEASFDAPRESDNFTPLLNATFMGYFSTVLFLVEVKADINHRTGLPEHSAVFLAAKHGNSQILSVLIRAKAELDDRNNYHMRALDIAAKNGHINIVKMLLEAKAQVNAESVDFKSCIHYAARHGKIQCLHLLYEAKANVNARDNSGGDSATPLHMVVSDQACKLDLVQSLISAKANANAFTSTSLCPVSIAIIRGASIDVVRMLLDAKADANLRDSKQWTPLHFAVYSSRPAVIRCLLEHGAQLNAQTDQLDTALHMACTHHCVEIIDMLINAGASLNARAKLNSTPLHYAAAANHNEVLQKLLRANAELDATRDFQWTPLHCAVYKGHGETAFSLLRSKASPTARDADHETPLHLASRKGYFTLVKALLQAKADASPQTCTELETPLHTAVQCRCLDTVLLLVNAKANLLARDIFGDLPIDRANSNDTLIIKAVSAKPRHSKTK